MRGNDLHKEETREYDQDGSENARQRVKPLFITWEQLRFSLLPLLPVELPFFAGRRNALHIW
jgi:hypothetical protein